MKKKLTEEQRKDLSETVRILSLKYSWEDLALAMEMGCETAVQNIRQLAGECRASAVWERRARMMRRLRLADAGLVANLEVAR